MGPQEDYVETVFTCEGDINDPDLQNRLEVFRSGLRDLLSTDKRKLILKKVEPWNSVRVTFNIPIEAARRLKQLAQQGNSALRQLGVLAVQLEGDQVISLTIAGRNNERTQLIFRAANDTEDASRPGVSVFNSGVRGSGTGPPGEIGIPGPSHATQKNIAEYLRQQGSTIMDTIFSHTVERRNAAQDIPRTEGLINKSSKNSSPSHSPAHKNGPREISDHNNMDFTPPRGNMQSMGPGIHLGADNQVDLPPPPPYPMGSTLWNNLGKGRQGMPSTSPLLVNLLQTEPHLAGLPNMMNNRMLPPSEMSPPPKKKRKPRKPKDKRPLQDSEAAVHNIPNPALDSCGLATSGNSSNMPTSTMVTQALPATTLPSVTYSTTQGHQTQQFSHIPNYMSSVPGNFIANPQFKDFMLPNKFQSEQFHTENTSGKIINPYTGLLEPVENSDSSPCKSDSSVDGYSPVRGGQKHSPKDRKLYSSGVSKSATLNRNVPSSVSPADMIRFHQGIVGAQEKKFLDFSSSLHTTKGDAGFNQIPTNISSGLPQNEGQFYPRTSALVTSAHSGAIQTSVINGTEMSGMNALHTAHSASEQHHTNLKSSLGQNFQVLTKEQTLTTSRLPKESDLLLNNSHQNPAKNPSIGSLMDSPGADSESSNPSVLHDHNMQNDIGAVASVCPLENKTYNHDSGVGSSSERSDDTPSEPGDDFKLGQNSLEEISKTSESCGKTIISKTDVKPKHLDDGCSQAYSVHNGGKTQTSVDNYSKAQSEFSKLKQNMDVTVGYAMSNMHENKIQNDISAMMTMDKVLNHLSGKTVYNNIGKNTTNTVLHWSTTDKFISNQMETKKHSSPRTSSSEVHNHLQAHLFPKQHSTQHNKSKRKTDSEHSSHLQAHYYIENDISYPPPPVVCRNSTELLQQNCLDMKVSPFSSTLDKSQFAGSGLDSAFNKDCEVGTTETSKVLCNSDNHLSLQYSAGHDSNKTSHNSVMAKDPQRKYSKSPHEFKNKVSIPSSSYSCHSSVESNVLSLPGHSMDKKVTEVSLSQVGYDGPIVTAVPKCEKQSHSSDITRNVTNMHKRRSPTGPKFNQQHFLNPALPLAKSLTESVQKVVKALPMDNSALPQQHKSSVGVSSKASPSRVNKGAEHKSPMSDCLTVKQTIPISTTAVMNDIDSVDIVNSLQNFSDHNASSQGLEKLLLPDIHQTTSLPVLEIESSHGIEFGNIPIENHLGLEIDNKLNFHDTKSQSLLSNSKPNSPICEKDEGHNISCKEPNVTESKKVLEHNDTDDKVNHEQNNTKSSSKCDSLSRGSDTGAVPALIEPIIAKMLSESKSLQNKSHHLSVIKEKSEIGQSNKSGDHPSLKINNFKITDTKQEEDTSPVKSSDTRISHVKMKSDTTKNVKTGCDLSFKSKHLTLEEKKMEVTVVTKAKTPEHRQDKSEPTVPPLILRVRRKSNSETPETVKPIPEVLAANTDESHSSMTLRGKSHTKSPDDSTTVHNLRHTKSIKQTSSLQDMSEKTEKVVEKMDKDTNKNFLSDEESLKRNLRRRKPGTSESESEVKKVCLENEDATRQTRSFDIKDTTTSIVSKKATDILPSIQKTEPSKAIVSHPESDNSLALDTVKLGLRARSTTKTLSTDDKQKILVNKDTKKAKVDDENCNKNKNVPRQKKLSPTIPPEKIQQNAVRDKSPVRGNRTRGQTLPITDQQDESSKRSTRSTKPKDATDTLPPNSKRRRPSRDHR